MRWVAAGRQRAPSAGSCGRALPGGGSPGLPRQPPGYRTTITSTCADHTQTSTTSNQPTFVGSVSSLLSSSSAAAASPLAALAAARSAAASACLACRRG